jgi:hypothetical protein
MKKLLVGAAIVVSSLCAGSASAEIRCCLDGGKICQFVRDSQKCYEMNGWTVSDCEQCKGYKVPKRVITPGVPHRVDERGYYVPDVPGIHR